jgi:hypothetical protein
MPCGPMRSSIPSRPIVEPERYQSFYLPNIEPTPSPGADVSAISERAHPAQSWFAVFGCGFEEVLRRVTCQPAYSSGIANPLIRTRNASASSATTSPTMNVRTCSPTGPESCARDRMNAANDPVSLRRNRSSARAKSTSVSIVTGTPQETDLLARVASAAIIEMDDLGSRGALNFLASIPDFEPELPAFEAHHHSSKLFPGNLPSVDHEHG